MTAAPLFFILAILFIGYPELAAWSIVGYVVLVLLTQDW